ncbi:MAG: DNA polymerase IV [Halodesulfurarchaeum sp.]
MPMAGRLPGATTTDQQIVLHVDMDCFYASCERLREPELRGEPVVVGMGYEPGDSVGAVATASYEAREYGVESAQPISEALERLPRTSSTESSEPAAYYRPVDMEYYQEIAAAVREILHDLGDTVREVSIDEAYLDVTDRTDWDVAEGFSRHVKQRIRSTVGVPASVGAAPNMSAAKIASDHDKPDGLTVVPPDELEDFLADLPIEDLHGVGPVSASAFRELDIATIGDLADADIETIEDRFGDRGRELHNRARGIDDRTVTERGRPKSLSRETSFGDPVSDWDVLSEQVTALSRAVSSRVDRKDVLYQTVGIKVVLPPYDVKTRERTFGGPIDEPDLLRETALELLDEFEGESVRKVGVRVSKLSFSENEQSDLDSWTDRTDSSDTGRSYPRRGQVSLERFAPERR